MAGLEVPSTPPSHVVCIATALLATLWFAFGSISSVPGPREYPFIGALVWLSQYYGRLLDGIMDGNKRWGKLHTSPITWTAKWPMSPRYYFTARPDVVEHVLRSHFETFEKGVLFRSKLSDLLGAGIFVSDGERWREQRRAASHMFSLRGFRSTIMTAFVKNAPALEKELAENTEPGILNVSSLFYRYTLDSIGDIAFGINVDSLSHADQPFARAFDTAQALCETRFTHPGWQVVELLNGTRTKLNECVRVLREYSQRIIDDRRAAGDAQDRGDVLSRMMADGEGHDDAYLRDVVTNFLIAGRDTTASALGWAILLIATHPEVEARVVQEAQALFQSCGAFQTHQTGTSAKGGQPRSSSKLDYAAVSYDAVARDMPYTQAVLMEALRLFPSVPLDLKMAVRDDTLPDGTRVAAGEVVAWSPFAMGHSRAIWGADAGCFKPERFLSSDGATVVKPSPYKYPVFNAGPRTCLGQQMALTEASFVLAVMLQRFVVRLAPSVEPGVRAWLAKSAAGEPQEYATPVPFLESLTLPMRDGLQCVITRR